MEHITYARLEDQHATLANGTDHLRTIVIRGTNSTPQTRPEKARFLLGRPSPCNPLGIVSRRRKTDSFTPGLDTLVHIIPIGAAQLIDYGTDMITLFIFYEDGLRIQFAVGLGSMLLSVVVTWIGMNLNSGKNVGFHTHAVGGWHRLLIMALVPLNLHTLALGVVVAAARGALTAQSTDDDRAAVRDLLQAFATFKSWETGLESVPFAVLSVSALSVLSTESSGRAVGIVASLTVSLLSISYGFYSQAMSTAMQRNDDRPLPRGTSAQLFVCIAYHVCWVIGTTGMLVAASQLGPLRWVGLFGMLVCGGGSFVAAQVEVDVISPAVYLPMAVAASPFLSIFDHVIFGLPLTPAFFDSSPFARAIPIIRRAVIMACAVASAISSGSLRFAVLGVIFAAIDALIYRRLLLLGGLTQHPDASETPLVFVPSDSPHRCIFEHTALLRADSTLEVPATLTSHPDHGLVVSKASHLWLECNDAERPFWYHRVAIGAKQTAVSIRMDGQNLLAVTLTDDGPRTLALGVSDNTFKAGHHIVALGNAHKESEVQYDDPWPKYSGFPKTMERIDGRLFTFNNNNTISPVGAPHLVLGLRNALPEITVDAAPRWAKRSSSINTLSSLGSFGSLEFSRSLMEKLSSGSFSALLDEQADERGRWMLDALKSLVLQLGDTLQVIEIHLGCGDRRSQMLSETGSTRYSERESRWERRSLRISHPHPPLSNTPPSPPPAPPLPYANPLPPPIDKRVTRSGLYHSALQAEADEEEEVMSDIDDDQTARSANERWESTCHQLLERCDTMLTDMSTYSVAQQEALVRAFRAYIPKKDEDQTQEALMQTEALCLFSEAIEAALRATASEPASEPAAAPPLHPMRGTPLPDVLHSGVLTRKNAFGSLFNAKKKASAGLAADQDGPRDFDLSRDVERCDIFLSHSWGDDGKKKVALLTFYFEYSSQVASLLVICFIMVVLLFAFSVSLTSAMKLQTSTLIIVLTLAPIAILLLSLAWFALAAHGYLPTNRTPAFVSERLSGGATTWIDKTCADQQNLAGFLDQGIDSFMFRCNRMVAFTSKSYFTRAWCMFELAAWCHEHYNNLDGKLFLMSLDWDHFTSAYKKPDLSEEETDMLRHFSLDDVRSFKVSDQADVLAAIRKRWGTEQAFELFVQTKLPKVLAKCKRQYYALIQNTATETLEKALEAG